MFTRWDVFSAIAFTVILLFTLFPVAAAEEAHLFDEAFTVLTLFAVPVFTFVISVVSYSVLKFRIRGEPTEDGPPERGQKPLNVTWFAGSTILTAVLITFPGVTGILEPRNLDRQPADVVVSCWATHNSSVVAEQPHGLHIGEHSRAR